MKSTFTPLTIALAAAAFIFAATPAQADVLTPQQALSRARTETSTVAPARVRSMVATAQPRLVYTQNNDDQPTVYVFDQGTEATGYMVLSADDQAPAVLGYSDSPVASDAQINPQLRWWLGEYGRQIQWMRQSGTHTTFSKVKKANSADYAAITPMTTTRWNQNAPFNDDCPEINGTRTVTGCVATALAQIMKYHNWPEKGTGSNSYTPSSVGSTISVNFANTTYKWDDMINVYGNNATQAQIDAVATLMYSCGVAVNMDYTTDESSATSFAAAQAMVNYFNYDKGIMFYSRDYYTIDDWNDLVYNQLKNYGPVQYSGQSNDGGHSFVCDGYSQDGYFHINWGWGGMSDGYFLLTALNPTSQGIGGSTSGYNFDQDIIGNVKPADGSTTTITPNFAAQAFQPSATSVSLGNQVEFTGPFYSFSLASVSGSLGIKLVDANGTATYVTGSQFTNLDPEYGTKGFYVTLPANLAQGTYTISPAVKSSAGAWYDIPVMVGATKATSVTVSGGVATFTTVSASTLSVSDMDIKTDFYIGSDFEISATVTNTGSQEYLGGIGLVVVNSSDEEVAQGVQYPLDLAAGDSQDITYLSSLSAVEGATLSEGTYYICFVDENGNQLTDMQEVTINAASTPTLSLTDFTIEGGTTVTDKTNIVFTGNLAVTQGYFGSTLTLVIFPYSPGTGSVESVATFTTNPIFLSAGQSSQLSVNADFSNGTDGSQYFAMLYNGSSPAVNNQLVFKISEATDGVSDIDASQQVTGVEYYNLNGVRVSTAHPAPGLYIVRTTMADGSVTTQKTVIN